MKDKYIKYLLLYLKTYHIKVKDFNSWKKQHNKYKTK